jgi:hypothetical protein
MSPTTRYLKKHAKARQRRLHAQERLAQDRRQAQQAAKALQEALDDLGLPQDLVTEIEGRAGETDQISGPRGQCRDAPQCGGYDQCVA